jgi:hypothetical protein
MAAKEGCTVGTRGGVRRLFIFMIKIEWNLVDM